MHIDKDVQIVAFRCPRCGNREFPAGIQRPAFICPVIGCGQVIEPDNMPAMLPDPIRSIAPQAAQMPSVPGDSLIYDRDEYGEWVVKGVYGDPTVISVPSMVNGRAIMGIAPRAFAELKKLRRVTLPDTVATIGEEAFAGCTELESISFGSGLTLLDRGCLRGCERLFDVMLPEKLQEIGREAFSGCTSLTHVSLGGSVRLIRDCAFQDCVSLSTFTYARVPERTAITAFSGCYSLDPSVEPALFPDSQLS